jgi:hypothetical protein
MTRAQQLEDAIGKLLNLCGLSFHRVSNYRCFNCGQVQNSKAAGFPDFYVYYPFRLYIEAKTGSGRLTKDQKIFKDKVELIGDRFLIVRDNIDALAAELKRRKVL